MTPPRSRSVTPRRPALLLLLALAAAPLPACRSVTRASIVGPPEPTAPVGQLLRIPTRPKVFVTYLLLAESPKPPPTAIALMLPGGSGLVHVDRVPSVPTPSPSADLLLRSRGRFLSRDLALAIVDAPSDRPNGMDDAFRAGAAHAADIEAVVQSLRERFPQIKIFLVGSDRGAISAAHLALRFPTIVDGAVIVSAPFRANVTGLGLTGFDWSKIQLPLVFVHHTADECRASPYEDAQTAADQYSIRLEGISGGQPADSGPCDPLSAHGYYGREEKAAETIRSWILGDHEPPQKPGSEPPPPSP